MNPQQDWLDTDFYAALAIADTATPADVKKAYKKLARELHPDKNPGDTRSEERFKAVSRANQVLSDPATRKEYDEYRRLARSGAFGGGRPAAPGGRGWPGGAPGGPGGQGDTFVFNSDDAAGFDLGDLLGGLFNGGGAGRGRGSGPRPGADVRAHLTMDFADAMSGLETTITVGDRQVKTRLPAGVEDGQTIRLRGKGQPGPAGGPAGDLLLEVNVAPDARFGRKGKDLTVTVPITYTEAVLGAQISAPTLDGSTVRLRVPPGTRNGRTLRAKGKGAGGGDLLVSVEVAVPQNVSDEERALLERLAELERGRPSPREHVS